MEAGGPHVDAVRLTPHNLPLCAPLWGGRETYAANELSLVLEGAGLLLTEGRALGAIVREDGTPRSFGMTTFATEEFISDYLGNPHPHVGRRLLLDARNPDAKSILTLAQIAERNVAQGLQVVVANTAFDTASRDPDTVLGQLIAAFLEVHRGYRIARIVNEVFGAAAMLIVRDSRCYEIARVFDLGHTGEPLESLVGTLTREQAAAWKNPLLAMFAYSPPRLFFTPAEQHLIAEALAGGTDATLSARLGIPRSAVKARWTRIQQRVARTAPELFADVPLPHRGRGVQTRHLILNYVRQHPSELTPYPSLSVARRLRASTTRSRVISIDQRPRE